MKRMMVAGLLAVAVASLSGQEASAWCKFNFGFGFNVSYEGGDNCCLWGLCKSGPAPGCCDPCCIPQCCDGGAPALFPAAPLPSGGKAPADPKTLPPANPTAQQVGYFYGQQNYGYGADYGYYTGANYGYQAPSYWYGR